MPSKLLRLAQLSEADNEYTSPLIKGGRVRAIDASGVSVSGFESGLRLRQLVKAKSGEMGEVTAIGEDRARLLLFSSENTLQPGDLVFPVKEVDISNVLEMPGRTLNALAQPIDGKAPLDSFCATRMDRQKPESSVLKRPRIAAGERTGVRAIDIFTPLCLGQRVGLFAGSGVGKSTLLSMLSGGEGFDAIVVAMVGERSREVGDFLNHNLNAKARAKTCAIVATANEPPALRRRAPELAMKISSLLANEGQNVLLLVDSLTRYAHALREIGIANGEMPVARGYPPSVFAALPALLEMAGASTSNAGSVTLIGTVLVDGDDHNDPVADALRGILDGHIVMDRSIAEAGRYPAVDPLKSISRLADRVWTEDDKEVVLNLRSLIFSFEESSDLRQLGGWSPGNDPRLDQAVELVPKLYNFLKQDSVDDDGRNPFGAVKCFLEDGQLPQSVSSEKT